MKSAWSFFALSLLCLAGCVSPVGSGAPCENAQDCAEGFSCALPVGGGEGICRREGHGRLGSSCDTTTGEPCRYLCLILESGEGQCTEPCGDDYGQCPTGYQCAPVVNAADGDPPVCQPASCGSLDYFGACQGDVLSYCSDNGPVQFDCSTLLGDDGQPLHCGLVNQDHGHDCVSQDFGQGCGGIPLEGMCQDNTIFFCTSLESGTVQQISCDAGETCTVDDNDGVARCLREGSQGCGEVTYAGYCDGNTAVWCEDDQVLQRECGSGEICGFVNNEVGYFCQNNQGPGSQTVTGAFNYERPRLTEAGLGATQRRPVRHALVQVRQQSDDSVLASDYTRADGSFSLSFQSEAQVYVIVWATHNAQAYKLTVRDCPLQDCQGDGAVYAANTEAFSGSRDMGDLTIPRDGVAGAFNIFDVMVRGSDLASYHYGRTPPAVVAQWARGSNTFCGTSCYSPRSNMLFITGTTLDTDEFDDPVIGHEFGHFVEAAFSRSDSPGGAHDGSPTDPRLAWGEGYGTFIGCTIWESGTYIDTFASGQSVIAIDQVSWTADAGSPRGQNQLLSEFVVAQALWLIANGDGSLSPQGNEPIFDVLGNYLPSGSWQDRGVSGVDLVDFLDGWFCRGHGAEETIERNINNFHGFPYDFNGPANCR